MRPIEFRAKRIDNGEWVYGDLVNSFEGTHISPSDYFKPSNDQHPELLNVDGGTVGQFTGLHDKNGNKIWEGDILREIASRGYLYKIWREKGGLVINQFQDDFYKEQNKISFWAGTSDMQTSSFIESSLEIIGNIHENQQP